MYGHAFQATTYTSNWPITAPWETTMVVPSVVIIYRPLVSNISRDVEEFARVVETLVERRLRISRARTREAIRAQRRTAPPRLEARQYDRPRRKGRACGSRHRVMLCP